MNKIFVFLFFVIISTCNNKEKKIDRSLTSIEGETLTIEELKNKNVFVLINSLHCGYCRRDIPFYNEIAEKYNHNLQFIVLLNNDADKINAYKKDNSVFYNNHWTLIPDQMDLIEHLWEHQTFPEYFIFENGEKVKSFVNSNKITHANIKMNLKRYK